MAEKKKRSVLIINDDSFLREMYSQKFEEAGCSIQTLKSLNGDIVTQIADIGPEAITLDIVIAGRDGFQALSLLKADERTKNIPVFVVSNQSAKEDVQKSLELGAIDHLIAARFTPSALAQTVVSYLENPSSYTRAKYS